jgi:hypothetical protein
MLRARASIIAAATNRSQFSIHREITDRIVPEEHL